MLDIPFAVRLIVCANEAIETPDGFARVDVDPGLPQSASVQAGISALASFHVDAVLIALADMPCVPAAHFDALLAAFDPASGRPVASGWAGSKPMPPAVFSRAHWPALTALAGDQGARSLLKNAHVVLADKADLIDVDVVDDLQ